MPKRRPRVKHNLSNEITGPSGSFDDLAKAVYDLIDNRLAAFEKRFEASLHKCLATFKERVDKRTEESDFDSRTEKNNLEDYRRMERNRLEDYKTDTVVARTLARNGQLALSGQFIRQPGRLRATEVHSVSQPKRVKVGFAG